MRATEAIRSALCMSYDWNRMLAEDLRDAPMTFPTPRGGNHPTWVVGHLVHARSGLLAMITGEPSAFFEEWDAMLGGESDPVDQPEEYPSYGELMDTWQSLHEQTLVIIDRLDDSALDQPPASIPDFLKDNPKFQRIGSVLLFMAMHEISHRGQLADARRAAGRGLLGF